MILNPLRWRHNVRDSVSNHQPHDCLLNCLFRRRSKKTSKLHVTGLCVGNSPGSGEFPAQMASNAENVSIWWRHHAIMAHYYQMISQTFAVISLNIDISAMPFSEPMQAYCWLNTQWQLSVIFGSKYKICPWKCRLQNGGYFGSIWIARSFMYYMHKFVCNVYFTLWQLFTHISKCFALNFRSRTVYCLFWLIIRKNCFPLWPRFLISKIMIGFSFVSPCNAP